MVTINKVTKTITITSTRIKLVDMTMIRRLENAGYTITIVVL